MNADRNRFAQPHIQARPSTGGAPRHRHERFEPAIDVALLLCVLALLGFGLVMVASASLPIAARDYADPFFFLIRHGIALALALSCGLACFAVPVAYWERAGVWLLLLGSLLLALVLVPGVGRTVNGATRWISLAGFNLQPSELIKLLAILYLAGYMVRRQTELRTSLLGVIRPMALILIPALLIVLQPDFGTTAVLLVTVLAMLFLGGVALWQFGLLLGSVGAALASLIWIEPYRLQRVTSFIDAFDDPFDTDYQLSHALIALGRGEWFGVGLGNGIQKQFYLPEAHTDFLLAVVGEEFGLIGVLVVVLAFAFVTWRAFAIGARAYAMGALFSSHVAHGIGLLLGLQAFINAGVNTGLLPTKGLPLPFLSYGSNALVVSVMAVAVLLRVDMELRARSREPMPEAGILPSMAPPGGVRWRRA